MTKHDEGLTAAIYAPVCEDRDGTGLGVARQEKDCKALPAASAGPASASGSAATSAWTCRTRARLAGRDGWSM